MGMVHRGTGGAIVDSVGEEPVEQYEHRVDADAHDEGALHNGPDVRGRGVTECPTALQ